MPMMMMLIKGRDSSLFIAEGIQQAVCTAASLCFIHNVRLGKMTRTRKMGRGQRSGDDNFLTLRDSFYSQFPSSNDG